MNSAHGLFAGVLRDNNEAKTISHEGGVVHKVSDATLFDRFLILGSFGTFYADSRTVTEEAIERAQAHIAANPYAAMAAVQRVMGNRLAFRRDPSLLALAMLTLPSVPLEIRRQAASLASEVIVTGTDLLHWIDYRSTLTGGKWNRLSRRIVTNYFTRERSDLELQVSKYMQRDGWAMRDALRVAHPIATDEVHSAIFDWAVHASVRLERDWAADGYRLFEGYKRLRLEPENAAQIIHELKIPRELVPAELLNQKDVWVALTMAMPAQALFRNLGKLSSLGIVDTHESFIVNKIGLATNTLHPLQFLVTWKQYASGRGEKGSNTWDVNRRVVAALESGYVESFKTLEVMPGIKPLIALDVSGSMGAPAAGLNMSCIELECCMVEILAKQFPDAAFYAFSDGKADSRDSSLRYYGYNTSLETMQLLTVHGKSRMMVADEINAYSRKFGGTDCSLPLRMALSDHSFDAVITITDSESGHRGKSPSDLVKDIHASGREEFRHAVVALATNRVSVADPSDHRQMDVSGASADLPNVLAGFLKDSRRGAGGPFGDSPAVTSVATRDETPVATNSETTPCMLRRDDV